MPRGTAQVRVDEPPVELEAVAHLPAFTAHAELEIQAATPLEAVASLPPLSAHAELEIRSALLAAAGTLPAFTARAELEIRPAPTLAATGTLPALTAVARLGVVLFSPTIDLVAVGTIPPIGAFGELEIRPAPPLDAIAHLPPIGAHAELEIQAVELEAVAHLPAFTAVAELELIPATPLAATGTLPAFTARAELEIRPAPTLAATGTLPALTAHLEVEIRPTLIELVATAHLPALTAHIEVEIRSTLIELVAVAVLPPLTAHLVVRIVLGSASVAERNKRVEICNAALLLIGVELINAHNDGSPQAIACRAWFPTAFNRTLTRIPWPFAHARVEIKEETSSTAVPPSTLGEYLYDQPGDFVRLWTWADAIHPTGTVPDGDDYIRSPQPPPLWLSYMRDVPLSETSETFIEILVFTLAGLLKQRFPKPRVSGEAFSQRQLQQTRDMLVREAASIEISQIHHSRSRR